MPLLALGTTLATTWEESIQQLLACTAGFQVATTTGGDTWEVESVVLHAIQPLAEPRISDRFLFPEIIEDFAGLVSRTPARRSIDVQTIADRIYAWRTDETATLNQLQLVRQAITDDPLTRRAVIALWDPTQDLANAGDAAPLGHCCLYFSVREDRLNLCVVSRSVDAWLGAMPNMLAFVGLQERLAHDLGIAVGTYTQQIMSYHIYIHHLPRARHLFGPSS